MSAPPDAGLDPRALALLRRAGGQDLLRQMVAAFLEHAPGRIASLGSAVAAGSASQAEMAAHSLKSSAGQMGARAMQELCERAERSAQQGQLGSLGGVAAELEAELVRVKAWLEAESAEGK